MATGPVDCVRDPLRREVVDRLRWGVERRSFWLTLDVFFRSDADFARVRDAKVLTAEKIGELYGVDPALVKRFELPEIKAMKFSMPRAVVAGSFEDRDLHAGQQYLPLAMLPIPG
jgi:hypothetical protein